MKTLRLAQILAWIWFVYAFGSILFCLATGSTTSRHALIQTWIVSPSLFGLLIIPFHLPNIMSGRFQRVRMRAKAYLWSLALVVIAGESAAYLTQDYASSFILVLPSVFYFSWITLYLRMKKRHEALPWIEVRHF
ncbi:MAG: hypothetical protein ABIR96_09270 [Bdellovibrionota bacterium]